MGRACSNYGEEVYAEFGRRNLRGRDRLEKLDVDGKLTVKIDLQDVRWEGIDWIDPAQNSNWWRVIVNAVMNLRVP
jgi:hypothetical protein